MSAQKSLFVVGQIIEAQVERVIDREHFVASIDGRFYTVANNSSEKFQEGQRISLYVESAQPIRLKLSKRRDGLHIDYNI